MECSAGPPHLPRAAGTAPAQARLPHKLGSAQAGAGAAGSALGSLGAEQAQLREGARSSRAGVQSSLAAAARGMAQERLASQARAES